MIAKRGFFKKREICNQAAVTYSHEIESTYIFYEIESTYSTKSLYNERKVLNDSLRPNSEF